MDLKAFNMAVTSASLTVDAGRSTVRQARRRVEDRIVAMGV
jgi:hypothetical protein